MNVTSNFTTCRSLAGGNFPQGRLSGGPRTSVITGGFIGSHAVELFPPAIVFFGVCHIGQWSDGSKVVIAPPSPSSMHHSGSTTPCDSNTCR